MGRPKRVLWDGIGGKSAIRCDLGRAALENYTEQKTVWLRIRPNAA